LVPCTGVFPIELTLGDSGAKARTAAEVARRLKAIGGPDGLNLRPPAGSSTQAQPAREVLQHDRLDGLIHKYERRVAWRSMI
jgi:hypothetical protein